MINIISNKIIELEKEFSITEFDNLKSIFQNVELKNYSGEEIVSLLEQFSKLKDIGFRNSIELHDYFINKVKDYKNYKESRQKAKTNIISTKEKEKELGDDKNEIVDVENLIDKFSTETHNIYKDIKGFFIFKLEFEESKETSIYFIHDKNMRSNPHINTLKKIFNDKLIIYSLEEFTKLYLESSTKIDNNVLIFLLISENINQDNESIENLRKVINKYKGFTYYEFYYDKDIKAYRKKIMTDKNEFINNLKNYSKSVFNNSEFCKEEEILVKKFFTIDCSVLNYRSLKPGFSGSKVIEVQGLKSHGTSIRYVVKIDKREKRKIEKEFEVFKTYLKEYGLSEYDAAHSKSENFEAICYKYASCDGNIDSSSLSDIIINELYKEPSSEKVKTYINKLFEIQPFKIWQESILEIKNSRLGSIYKEYTNNEDIYKFIKQIEDKDISKIELISDYTQLLSENKSINRKYCHGDLHTQNIFIDDKEQIYLIDFGWTGEKHAIIDHVILESSIKFNHIPRYIPIDELLNLENEINCIESFNENYQPSTIKRHELKKIFEWIFLIRQNAKKLLHDDNNPNEYFLSLFFITYRQIQYKDLNQLYALRSAEQLSKLLISTHNRLN